MGATAHQDCQHRAAAAQERFQSTAAQGAQQKYWGRLCEECPCAPTRVRNPWSVRGAVIPAVGTDHAAPRLCLSAQVIASPVLTKY